MEAITKSYLSYLQNPDAWALMGHVKYLTNETSEARDCYERTISFVADASEMHSIYLRLASIYLQEARVSWLLTISGLKPHCKTLLKFCRHICKDADFNTTLLCNIIQHVALSWFINIYTVSSVWYLLYRVILNTKNCQ